MTDQSAKAARRQTDGRKQLYDNVLDTIGNTPVVRINRLAPEGVELYVKAEFFNPGASVKDRLAISIIEEAERSGALSPGQTVVEATSGNTGVGLAMVCAAKGYPLVVTMAETFSVERRQLMRMFGAKVILTPKEAGGTGMYAKARELADAHGWFWAGQFETEANALIHANTTAREILADFDGRRLDAVVTGYGTGGTVSGLGRVLREARPDLEIVLCEPANAQLLGSGIPQERTEAGGPASGHPAFEPHPIQGWTPNFIPLVLQEAIDNSYYDRLVPIAGADGMAMARKLAANEGILTGVSGGSTFSVALDMAQTAEPGTVILAMLPDTGERYLSTPLFDHLAVGMSDEEETLAATTPGFLMS
ncbi:PLP-dependent cysteine synthase family protein [Tropicimonas sediminicola]|uniref:Cysteine synthase n=1 Tax=Tropicimonas sediminicola TaxID=1031541 RepID=A0A239K7J0_9RHOB|nr:pyridoxal-phosphate dependent enzyme [Tropicimonas sediminicola]SNT13652.1 cysteine synthase A [Tropicimonas sediminicola]